MSILQRLATLDPVPIAERIAGPDGIVVRSWVMFFEQLRRLERLSIEGTHAERLADWNPEQVRPGTQYYETDRDHWYICRVISGARVWRVLRGRMRGLFAALPAGLTTDDVNFEFEATDKIRVWRWTGTGWTYLDGQREAREIIWYPGSVPTGWALCDGSSVAVTNGAAVSGSYTTPDLVGKYLKGANAYTGSPVTGTTPTISGSTGTGGAHTPTGSAAVTNTGSVASGTGSSVNVAQAQSASLTINPVPDHTHGAGSLALSGPGEPDHFELVPCVKL